MGKKNFSRIYIQACNELGVSKPKIKLSHFCDEYNPRKNYAGIIIYHHRGEYQWTNGEGVARGHRGRAFYVLIECTDDWPRSAFRRAGEGLVHDYMYTRMFNRNFQDGMTCCGGFAIMKGEVKYSSIWLNKQSSSVTRFTWATDGNKNLSAEEQVLVDLATTYWKRGNKGAIIEIPDEYDAILTLAGLLVS